MAAVLSKRGDRLNRGKMVYVVTVGIMLPSFLPRGREHAEDGPT